MRDRLDRCVEFSDERSMPSVSEKGKTFTLDNRESRIGVRCIKVDDCVFMSIDGKKCDYIFEVSNRSRVYFIELKGSDIVKAISQLLETIEKLKIEFVGWNMEAHVVSGGKGKVPASVKDRREYEHLYRLCNGKVRIHHEFRKVEKI